VAGVWRLCVTISIHSPRAGRDLRHRRRGPYCRHFNPLSPCGERLAKTRQNGCKAAFQSTLPVRGETRMQQSFLLVHINFNPLSPCGERHDTLNDTIDYVGFQSTLPVRGETRVGRACKIRRLISIHSPRAGRDLSVLMMLDSSSRFQSTLPVRGETYSYR